ncbi:MAG TPA: hypothetical protein VFE53_08370 [Mucilaginibacter sp.]|jgi:hypothetical protein|nr:hypothetical protein [Mucilaginibacter sp.]
MNDKENPTCFFLRGFGKEIWQRIQFFRIKNSRISEVTITENMLYAFWQQPGLWIEIFEAKEEQKNGNDLEIYVQTPSGYYLIACQAKITNKNGKYSSISHNVGSSRQIDLLLEYAKAKGGYSAYLLYNYATGRQLNRDLAAINDIKEFGLSCSPAQPLALCMELFKLFKRRVPLFKFKDLHPHIAVPFYQIVCDAFANENSLRRFLFKAEQTEIRVYDRSQLPNEENWRRIVLPEEIERIDPNPAERPMQIPEDTIQRFNPQYRVVFNNPVTLRSADKRDIVRAHDAKTARQNRRI